MPQPLPLIVGLWFLLMACKGEKTPDVPAFPAFDIEGHRGARGYFPENSILGFVKALELGATTLEMDVVSTRDKELILSHEPWISSQICIDQEGKEIIEDRTLNIYRMSYQEVGTYDCGSKIHPYFPDQQKISVTKPRLTAAIDSIESYLRQIGLPPVWYNIEIKSTPKGDNIYHPAPEPFLDSLVSVIYRKKIENRTVIQSFDMRVLELAHTKYPQIRLSVLGHPSGVRADSLGTLGFTPEIYSCQYNMVSQEAVEKLHAQGIKVIPWTVNEVSDIQHLLKMGVDGIISDYPDRVKMAWEDYTKRETDH